MKGGRVAIFVVLIKMEEIFVDILGDADGLVHLALDERFEAVVLAYQLVSEGPLDSTG